MSVSAGQRPRRVICAAVKEYHAGSQIVYGATHTICVDGGGVLEPAVQVHRENIAKVELPMDSSGGQ